MRSGRLCVPKIFENSCPGRCGSQPRRTYPGRRNSRHAIRVTREIFENFQIPAKPETGIWILPEAESKFHKAKICRRKNFDRYLSSLGQILIQVYQRSILAFWPARSVTAAPSAPVTRDTRAASAMLCYRAVPKICAGDANFQNFTPFGGKISKFTFRIRLKLKNFE